MLNEDQMERMEDLLEQLMVDNYRTHYELGYITIEGNKFRNVQELMNFLETENSY